MRISPAVREIMQQSRREADSLASKLPEHYPGEALVKIKPDTSDTAIEDLADLYGAEVLEHFHMPQDMQQKFGGELLHLKLSEEMTTAEGIAALEKDPRVMYAEPNEVLSATGASVTSTERRTPDDYSAGRLWGMEKIQAPEAWSKQIGDRSNGPIIAVVDSGIDTDHPDLVANLWNNPGEIADGKDNDNNGVIDDLHGYNAIERNGSPEDDNRHGSHCAGTVAGVGNNGQGVVGVNWEGRLMGLKFLKADGKGATSNAVRSIVYASENGARVANHSWGSKGSWGNRALKDALRSSPALHLVAAGNDSEDIDHEPHYPAAFDLPNLIAVAATDRNDELASFSNWGEEKVHLAAPGTSIYSTVPDGRYTWLQGTSMATPHVTGVAAMLAAEYPEASNAELRQRLLSSVDLVPALRNKVSTGGRLNAARALEHDTQAPAGVNGFRGRATSNGTIRLDWTATGDDGTAGRAAGYELRYAGEPLTERNFEQASKFSTGLPAESGQPDGANGILFPTENEQNYHFGLKAYDNAGNSTGLVSTTARVRAADVAFDDDMDGWWSDWEGDWERVSEPGRGKVFTDSPNGNHEHDANKSLVSPEIRLGRNSSVTFDARYELENGRDKVHLELFDGRQWSELRTFSGEKDWQRYRVDLSAHDGREVKLRFRLTSDASVAFDGFYLDRLVVAGD